jgi:tetratricopeptide (TPR) repeat protein
LGATFAGDLERAETRVAAAERSQTTLGARRCPVLRARALLAVFRGDVESARSHAQACVELARVSGDPDELARALLVLASSLMLAEPDVATATLDEAIRVARDAGLASALAIGLPFLAGMLPIQESERALALIDEAIEVGTRLGDRYFVSVAIGARGGLALRRGDWRTALQAAVERVERQLQLGDLGSLDGTFLSAGMTLADIGKFEPAAVLFGKADALSPRMAGIAWAHEMLEATDVALLEALGEQQLATLTARGAALDNDDAVTYLRAQADAALNENPDRRSGSLTRSRTVTQAPPPTSTDRG